MQAFFMLNARSPSLLMSSVTPSGRVKARGQQSYPRLRASASDAFQLSVPQSLACGAVGRAVQISLFFPVDTIKTRVQAARNLMSSGSAAAVAAATSPLRTALSQGRFYSGVGINLMGQVPYAMLTFGLYETLKARFADPRFKLPEWASIMLAAGIGDSIGSLWLTPSEVIKSKTQSGVFKTPFAAIRGIASEGPLSFYQGYAAALARDVPFRAIQLVLYERCRRAYIARFASSRASGITPVENLLIGAFSGTITAVATNPLDVIRTRMMSQPVGKLALYSNAMECVVKTLTAEGLPAFLRGVGPRTLLLGPASAIFFLTYEATKAFFRARPGILSSRPAKPARVVATRMPNRCRRRHPSTVC